MGTPATNPRPSRAAIEAAIAYLDTLDRDPDMEPDPAEESCDDEGAHEWEVLA